MQGYCHNYLKENFKNTIYPSVSFYDDEHSEILQISDLIGLSLNNAIYNGIKNYDMNLNRLDLENLPNNNQFLKIYWPLFEKDWSGRVKGWGVKVWI